MEALVEEMLSEIPPLSLALLIEAISGFAVYDWEGQQQEALEKAALDALELINRKGVQSKRVNEVGNYVEEHIAKTLREQGFLVDTPLAQNGRRRATGYPDLEAFHGDTLFYIEVKTYNPDNVDTTQRSFYLSPSQNPKVIQDAYHLLIAFAMVPHPEEPKTWVSKGVQFLDLHNLQCELKFEFNASNRDLYNEEAGLVFFQAGAGD